MSDIFHYSRGQTPYSDSQTGASNSFTFTRSMVAEIASENIMFPVGQPSFGVVARDSDQRQAAATVDCDTLPNDRYSSYPSSLRIMARVGAVMTLGGVIIGIAAPGPITGAILPIGLILFSVAGWLARRQDRASN
jgi:hypothetical protein